jgi:hypothetical protein
MEIRKTTTIKTDNRNNSNKKIRTALKKMAILKNYISQVP